jgi:hypothetical protein
MNLAMLYEKMEKYDSAEASYMESLALYEPLYEANPDYYRLDVAKCRARLDGLNAKLH